MYEHTVNRCWEGEGSRILQSLNLILQSLGQDKSNVKNKSAKGTDQNDRQRSKNKKVSLEEGYGERSMKKES